MVADDRIALTGAPGSPYTRKMIALLRYRRIPYRIMWGGHHPSPEGYPLPKVKLLPTFYFPKAGGELEAVVDSTPIARRLEADFEGRSVIPADPVIAYLDALIEDYGDEWLTKQMFHYRWAYEEDAAHAAPLLVYWTNPTMAADDAKAFGDAFAKRQIDRLYVVGSNETTAATIEESYRRTLTLLDARIADRGYILGARPATCDFAAYGQLTQLVAVEPTPAAIAKETAPRVRGWLDRVEDLSGVEPAEDDWLARADARDALGDLLAEIGRVYVPFLKANAAAAAAGEESFETTIDGRPWTQPTFPYQAKCLAALRDARAALSDADRADLDAILRGSGCEALYTD